MIDYILDIYNDIKLKMPEGTPESTILELTKIVTLAEISNTWVELVPVH